MKELKALLPQAKDIDLVGEARALEQANTMLPSLNPHVIVLGIGERHFKDLDLVQALRKNLSSVSLILLGPSGQERYLLAAIETGAAACLSRETPAEFIISSIRRVAHGEFPIQYDLIKNPNAILVLLQRSQAYPALQSEEAIATGPLSPREADILGLIAQGYSNKQIANSLTISEQTVKNHISSVLRKLDASDRAHAAVLGLRHGWISLA